jgi:hypothetical protein
VPLVVAATAFALIWVPGDFGPRLDDWEIVMLWASTVGSMIGGAVLAGHFGRPGVFGPPRSAIAMLMALVIGGTIGGGAMGAALPPFTQNGAGIGLGGIGGLFALFFAFGFPIGFAEPFALAPVITLAGAVCAHLAGRVGTMPGHRSPFWHLLLVPLIPAVLCAVGYAFEAVQR